MNRRERIERIKGNIEYLEKNRISEEMKFHNRELYGVSERLTEMLKQ